MILAQLDAASPTAIKDWLIILGGILGLVLLVKQTFVRSPSIEAEFVTRIDHQKDVAAINQDIDSLRGKIDKDSEKVLSKLNEVKDDLKLEGSRRSKTLFEHIDKKHEDLARRLNAQDINIAKLEERSRAKS